jgi:ring-1,2-phenylacetyl-CoA epoxidase subunit PaaB
MKAHGCVLLQGPTPQNTKAIHARRDPLPAQGTSMADENWPLYEVFIRSRSGLSHRHAGSVHAADDQMALDHARDVYTRRSEGVSIWVVRSSEIVASDPAESAAFFDPAADKIYRHPTFYEVPDGVENL